MAATTRTSTPSWEKCCALERVCEGTVQHTARQPAKPTSSRDVISEQKCATQSWVGLSACDISQAAERLGAAQTPGRHAPGPMVAAESGGRGPLPKDQNIFREAPHPGARGLGGRLWGDGNHHLAHVAACQHVVNGVRHLAHAPEAVAGVHPGPQLAGRVQVEHAPLALADRPRVLRRGVGKRTGAARRGR